MFINSAKPTKPVIEERKMTGEYAEWQITKDPCFSVSYVIRLYLASNQQEPIRTFSTNNLSLSLNELTFSTEYVLKVKAVSSNDNALSSDEAIVSFTTGSRPAPSRTDPTESVCGKKRTVGVVFAHHLKLPHLPFCRELPDSVFCSTPHIDDHYYNSVGGRFHFDYHLL